MLIKELREAKSVAEANSLLSTGDWVCLSQHVIDNNITYVFGKYDFSELNNVSNIRKKGKRYSLVSSISGEKD